MEKELKSIRTRYIRFRAKGFIAVLYGKFMERLEHRPSNAVIKDIAIGAGGLRFDSRAIKSDTMSPTAYHRCDVSLGVLLSRS